MPALRALNEKRHLSLVAQNTGPLPPAALPALEPFGCGRCGKVTRAFTTRSVILLHPEIGSFVFYYIICTPATFWHVFPERIAMFWQRRFGTWSTKGVC